VRTVRTEGGRRPPVDPLAGSLENHTVKASIRVEPPDPASTVGLSEAVGGLLEALETFSRFEGQDPAGRRSSWQPRLDEPLPMEGAGPEVVLETLRSVVIPNGLRVGAPGFCGWIVGMPSTVPAAAHFAGTISAPARGWVTAANFIEELALRWLQELLGLPATYQGVFTSGGSVANLVGLGVARQHASERRGVDASREGLHALPGARVYAGENAHHSVHRALGVLGLGRQSVRVVASSAKGFLDPLRLSEAIRSDKDDGFVPVAIVAAAGDVNTGAVDPIEAIAEVADGHGVWFHVDGAYGAFGVLDERVRPLFGGFRGVDSLSVDPHKWMATPIGCGAVFVRDRELLGRTYAMGPADYIAPVEPSENDLDSPFDEYGLEFFKLGLELSAPSRGLAVWALLKEIGAAGLAARVSRHLDCARRVADRVRESDELELLAEPVLSICCFRFHPADVENEEELAALNAEIVRRVRARGRVPSTTRVAGSLAIRPCFINPRTTLADADLLVDDVLAEGSSISASH
jgi:aromatic-L-amino-acid/L-tryptophan decarboxylase